MQFTFRGGDNMRLAEVKIRGYRKLVDTTCRFTGKLTAVVGPNEAGKTTLLELLLGSQDDDEIPTIARPRGLDVSDDDDAFQLWYRLDDDDLAALKDIESPDTPLWYVVAKPYGGVRNHWTVPELRRHANARKRAASALFRFSQTQGAQALERSEDDEGTGDLLDVVLRLVSSLNELEDEESALVEELVERLDQPGASATCRRAITELRAWRAEESETNPHDRACSILDGREPLIVAFDEPQRSLRSSYALAVEAKDPSPALSNLADLAELDVSALQDAFENDDPGAAETATDGANRRLRERLNVAWQQSEVEVHLRQDGDSLRLLVRTDAPRFSTVAERSEGLKTFVALTAFAHLLSRADRPLILLVDEAEQHLHYDAQADLVRMLDRQSVAAQVIYTTHSAGCLPSDLGTGVRAVVPEEGKGRSHIANSLWQAGPGFTPLLMALGASAAAFAPSRYAVIGEGATEMLLLPSMIREAVEAPSLDYQVASGLAEVGNGALRHLELEAPRVAFVLDGDAGGEAHAIRLAASGIDSSLVIHVGGRNSGLTIEDLVREDVYLGAVNQVLKELGASRAIPKSALGGGASRTDAVKKWCLRHQVTVPGKPAVAIAILDGGNERLLTTRGRRLLAALHEQIHYSLGIPLHRP